MDEMVKKGTKLENVFTKQVSKYLFRLLNKRMIHLTHKQTAVHYVPTTNIRFAK